MVVAPGLTGMFVPEVYPLTSPKPVIVNEKGPVPPVIVTTRFAVCPLQMVVVPLKTAAVIAGFTVTTTGVPKLAAAHPLASVNAVTEYVPVAAVGIVNVVEG